MQIKGIQVNEEIVPSLAFTHSKFISYVPENLSEFDYTRIIQPLFISFYREKTEKIINRRARKYLVYFEVKPSIIKVQSLKT